VVEAVYGLNNGAIATYSGSYVSQGRNTSYSGSWRIEGSTGQLTFAGSDKNNPLVLSRRDPEEQRELPLLTNELAGPAQVCRDFLFSLEIRAVPPTDATDNIKSLAMCWAADVSAKENRIVKFEEFA
jgi:predicted dehydrogenase